MKRTCSGCKALNLTGEGCGFGYKTEKINHPTQFWLEKTKPLEECPKPKTNMDFIRLWNEKKGK